MFCATCPAALAVSGGSGGARGGRWAGAATCTGAGGERAALPAALCSRFPLYYVTEPSAALKIQHYKLIVMLPH